jgi:hypothetical protein
MPAKPVLVSTPPQGPDVFAADDSASHQAQAAILLSLARQFHVARRWLGTAGVQARAILGPEPLPAGTSQSWKQARKELHESLTLDAFPVPLLKIEADDLAPLVSLSSAKAAATMTALKAPEEAGAAFDAKRTIRLARKCFAEPVLPVARDLVLSCLGHPSELVRVAAAIAAFPVTVFSQPLAATLEKATRSRDQMVRELALYALGIFDPSNPVLQKFLLPRRRGKGRRAHTSLLVHGTWARTETWWQPQGDFHSYVLENVRKDLYSAPDRYDWTGAYSDTARDVAAGDLVDWFGAHAGPAAPSIIAHSHGGNVAMLATWKGLTIDTLVLLSCPVHTNKYMPNFSNVSRVLSLHVTNDYVILLDVGRQRFNHPKIKEWVLPIWFNHSATHEPDVWIQYDVAEQWNLVLV